MDVLVIGGTRFIGKAIVRRLLDRGDRVTIFSRGNRRPDFWPRIRHVGGDRTSESDFRSGLSGQTFDTVIDTTCYTAADARLAVDVLGGQTSKYLMASTISVYGGIGHALEWRDPGDRSLPDRCYELVDLRSHVPIREDALDLGTVPWELDPQINEYAQNKRQAERVLSEAAEFPAVRLRIPITMGPGEPGRRLWWYLQRVLDGEDLMLRDGGMNMLQLGFTEDIAQAFIDAMLAPDTAGRVYNIGQPEIMTLTRFVNLVATAADRPSHGVRIPADAAMALGDLPWEDWRFDPLSRPAAYVMDTTRARCDFGLAHTPVEEWVAESVLWHLATPDLEDSFRYSNRSTEVEVVRQWKDFLGRLVKGA